jgi:hypothetical protein
LADAATRALLTSSQSASVGGGYGCTSLRELRLAGSNRSIDDRSPARI